MRLDFKCFNQSNYDRKYWFLDGSGYRVFYFWMINAFCQQNIQSTKYTVNIWKPESQKMETFKTQTYLCPVIGWPVTVMTSGYQMVQD
jgi:hypothetical protein